MNDCVYVRRFQDGVTEEYELSGVRCTRTEGIAPERAGFAAAGEICLRIPGDSRPELCCGDQICPAGSEVWYTVAEMRDNVVPGSGLSHWKVIGKR